MRDSFPHPRQHLVRSFCLAILGDIWCCLIKTFVCTSLKTDNIEHLFMCLFAIHISSLVNCLFKSFAHFKGNNVPCSALSQLSGTSPASHKQIGPFLCWFPGGWVFVHSRAPWVSPTNSPVRLGVSSAATIPTDFCSQRFWGFISPGWNPGLRVSHSPVVPPGLSTHECKTAPSSSRHLAMHPLQPSCPSLPLLAVWMNVSSLTPWLSDFHS